MATEQIAIRLSEDQLADLDDLVEREVYPTRAAAVRAGIEAVTEIERRRQIDAAIVDGYRRIPQSDADLEAARVAVRQMILEESW